MTLYCLTRIILASADPHAIPLCPRYPSASRYSGDVKQSQFDVYLARTVKILVILVLVPIVIHLWSAMGAGYTNDMLLRVGTGRP